MKPRPVTSRILADRVAARSISAASMIVTVFGDAVSQHGGWIWLGSLIEALAPFGFGERRLRTAANRLARQDWLKAERVGRRSYFCFTEQARGHYERAARRIYSPARPEWDGHWTLVLIPALPEGKRDALIKSLSWQGFSSLASGLHARPSAEREELDDTIAGLGLAGQVTVFKASAGEPHSQSAVRDLARRKWNLDALKGHYDEFLSFYRPLARERRPGEPAPEESFWLRTLMVHDYRRILLRDPGFPDEILPAGWSGSASRELIKRAYKALAAPSADYICRNLKNAEGSLPAPRRRFHRRFADPV
ncbi:MAG: phenylacetic acid degradation operon negative regulatory protein PaaX [Gammaproteobacteria bacterium]|nr:phenylacetic acid degradation operon negative regulatory protein PaaX [Gammaproteobacteria bacterium]MCY4341130.1 phenylacetic acid degradation operon negative regulatory protein PaaX [Gammaproteobacteria bacterium]